MKDEKFVKASEDAYYSLNLSEFSNFHQSGNIEGMRARYYGKDAYLVQAGNFIYHVDEDTFHAVKDYDFIRQQPEWLQEVSKTLADSKIQKQASLYIGSPHSQTVISLSIQADIIRKMLEQIDKSVTEARLAGPNAEGEMYVSCKFNGEHKLISLTQNDKKSLLDLMTDERDAKIKMIAARELAEPLFNSVVKEIKNNQEQTAVSTSNAMDDDHILLTANKISAVLEKFYSLHEADELTRIITDPSKGVEDVKACLDVIRQQNLHEQMRDRITSAMLIPGEGCRMFISAQIDGKLMPRKELTEADVQLMGSEDLGALNETSFAEKVKGLALTYYKDVLSLSPVELVDAEEVMQPLTRDDLHSYMELEQALQKKFPEGLTLQVPQLTTDELFNYIIYDKFHDDNLRLAGIGEQVPPSEETLQAEVHIPADKLGFLIPSPEVYNDDSYSYAINDFEVQDVCEAGVSELMHKHPDLQGAVLNADKWLLVKYMRVEGRPLDACLAWILQDCKLDVPQLKHLMNDTALAEQKLADIRKAGFSDYDRQRLEKIGSPKLLDMTHNRNYIYFHEKGTLGFAVVDRARGVTYSGGTLSREAQDFINDFASNKNLQVGGHHTFFMMPGVNSEKRAYLDTMKEKLVLADIQQNAYGGVMTTNGMNVLNEGDMQHFQDITGRVTDARIIGIDKPMVRCKIDGEQQMARPLGKSDIIRCGNFMSYSDEMKGFALSMAVKYFATDLYDNREQQQSKGMGR